MQQPNNDELFKASEETAEAFNVADQYARMENTLTIASGIEIIIWLVMWFVGMPAMGIAIWFFVICATVGYMIWCFASKQRWRSMADFRIHKDIQEFTRDKTLD